MKNRNKDTTVSRQRSGWVTAWLVIMITANALTAVLYLFAGDMVAQNFSGGISNSMLMLFAILAIGNVIYSILLFKWRKIGFWGILITSFGALIINLNIGLGIWQSLFGLVGITILYAVLQIKKEEISTWNNLD